MTIRAIDKRRATYPAKPDPDTVALAEYFRIKWHYARIARALAFGIACTRADLSHVSGVRSTYVGQIVAAVCARIRVQVEFISFGRNAKDVWRLRQSDVEALQAIIRASWRYDAPEPCDRIEARAA